MDEYDDELAFDSVSSSAIFYFLYFFWFVTKKGDEWGCLQGRDAGAQQLNNSAGRRAPEHRTQRPPY
jgi:hypothetical protein